MRQYRKAAVELILCAAFIFGLLPAQAASARLVEFPLAEGLRYAQITDGTSSSDAVQTYAMTYVPGGNTRPMVVYGDSVYGTTTPENVIAEVREKGYTPVAVLNADFFSMSSGVPEGLLVTDGVLRCSDSWQNAVGIRADGSFFLGAPQLKMQLTGSGKSVSITYINKLRTNQGVYLLTSDFDDTDHLSRAGTKVWLRILDGRDVIIGGTVELEVERIGHESGESAIPEGYMLLTVSDDGPGEQVKTLTAGDRLTLSVTSNDARWNEAVYACGAGAFLVSNGAAASGLSTSKRPVTALGLRADGSVVMIAADGRQSGRSAGYSLAEAARYLASQGCVSAVNLDGGGSTTIYTRDPGYASATLTNVPSDGSVRKCADYLVFVNTAQAVGKPDKLWIYPAAAYVLAGAEIDYSVLATDAALQPAATPSSVVLQAGSVGSVSGTRFTAGAAAAVGMISASAGGISGSTQVTVCTEVDWLGIYARGAKVQALTLEPGEVIDLNAEARVDGHKVIGQDSMYRWSVSGGVGTIDAEGRFTAGGVKGLEGTVTLSYGAKTVSLDIMVGRAPQLLDGFEEISGWIADEMLTMSAESDAAFVRYGYGSARIDCSLDPQDGEKTASARISKSFMLSDNADYLNIRVYGGKGMRIAPVVKVGGEEMLLEEYTLTDGWQQLRFAMPAEAESLEGLVITGTGTGTLRLDGMVVSPDAPLGANCTLSLQLTQADTGAIAASVRDTAGYLVRTSDIILCVDGVERAFVYDTDSGRLIADEPLPDDGKAHRVTLTVQDVSGNRVRIYRDIEAVVKETVFDDMKGHWAQTQANVLYARGVMNGEASGRKLLMNPGRLTTRQEMATFTARFLGYDVEEYASVKLPFADVGKIASWALPYVKVMYAEGLMQGSASGGKVYFNPEKGLTRAEVIAILGRTLPQGYAENSTVYADSASVPAWASAHLGKLVTLGVIGGYPDNTVRPGASVTRAEVAAMLYRIG